jgi:hypothetical protein
MTGGFKNGIEYPGKPFTAHAAITYAGTLVKLTTTEGEVDLNGAGERPDGYVHMGSMSLSTVVVAYAADAYVAVKGLVPGTVVEIPLPAVHSAITVGAEVETAASGCVIIKDGAGEIVGKAMKAVLENAGGFVTVWVNPRTAAA